MHSEYFKTYTHVFLKMNEMRPFVMHFEKLHSHQLVGKAQENVLKDLKNKEKQSWPTFYRKWYKNSHH